MPSPSARFFARTAGVATTERTDEATLIQTRHRIPETPLREGQILVYQVPIPEPLRWLEPRESETRKMHALSDYGVMHVKLYEDIARHGRIATSYDYPVLVDGRYLMRPSPIPKFDNPKMNIIRPSSCSAPGARSGSMRCRPSPGSRASTSSTIRSSIQRWDQACALCGSTASFLDEVVTDDRGGRMFVCSDTDYCTRRQDAAKSLGACRPMTTPLLKVTRLVKTYDGRIGCREISFELWPGEVIGIVGESGSGKTTLLNCLSARLKPDVRADRVRHARRRPDRHFHGCPRPGAAC